jgi:hypothetical protein
MSDVDALIDGFVQVLNRKPFVSVLGDQVPKELRTGKLSAGGDPMWSITAASNPWVTGLEDRLPFRLPKLYRSLIARYRYDEFEIGPILFLANIEEQCAEKLLSEKGMAPALLKAGLLQFGRPAGRGFLRCGVFRSKSRI